MLAFGITLAGIFAAAFVGSFVFIMTKAASNARDWEDDGK